MPPNMADMLLGGEVVDVFGYFFGDDLEPAQRMRAERMQHWNVHGVASARHGDAADTGHVVARVEDIPAAAEIGLEPGIEVHRRRIGRDADIAEITVAIACR